MLKTRFRVDGSIEAGIDEVGRGCLWGPLISVALIWPPEHEWSDKIREVAGQIKDSKKLTEKKRAAIVSVLKDFNIPYGIGMVTAKEIDEMGMTLSNQTAFHRAVQALSIKPDRLLIDGIIPLPMTMWNGEQHTIVEGDANYIAIAAASIMAKHYRDTLVTTWCKQNNDLANTYGLLSSKGYGTLKHREAVKTHGPMQGHRRLFLRKILGDHIYTQPTGEAKQDKKKVQQQCQIQDDADI